MAILPAGHVARTETILEPTLKGAMALARSATGPLSPHLPAFVTSLIDQRYAVVCVRAKTWLATAFDAWLATQGVELAGVQDMQVDEFIRRPYRPRSDCQAPKRRHEPNALRQLLGYLRGQGLCAAAPIAVIPADVVVDNSTQHLRHERGLATGTIGYYRTITRNFLVHRS